MEFWCFYIQPSQRAIHLRLPPLQLVISLVYYETNKCLYIILCSSEREDFELHPLEMKPSVTEIKIPKNSNSKWNIDIQGDSVFKTRKNKKESWSSKCSVEAKEIKECSNVITCLGQDHSVEG